MGWLMADFTDQVVTVTLGRQNVGFVIVAFGACDAVFSLLCGKLSDKVGRLSVLVVGCLAQALAGGCIVYGKVDEGAGAAAVGNMCSVVPGGNQWDLALGIAVLWALGDAAIRTQVDTIVSESFSTTTTITTTITTSTSTSTSSISSTSIDKGNTTNNTASADAAAVSDAGRTTDSLGAALSNYRMAQSLMIAVSFLFPVMGLPLWRTTAVLVALCITGVVCVALKARLYQQAHEGSGEESMAESTNYANVNATVHNAIAKGSCCVDAKCEEEGATPDDLEDQVLERA
jgi:MFS family permease